MFKKIVKEEFKLGQKVRTLEPLYTPFNDIPAGSVGKIVNISYDEDEEFANYVDLKFDGIDGVVGVRNPFSILQEIFESNRLK